MLHYRILASLFAATLLVLAGCQQAEPEVAVPVAPAPAVEATNEPTADEAAKVDPRSQVLKAMAQYEAPYPQRGDLFVAPKAAPKSAGTSSEGSVQLRGLVNVGELQAILDVEGATALVPVGSEKYGVKVVSIEDREVTLQRGLTKWTASLE